MKEPLSDSAAPQPIEARFQAEFYRASFQLLGNLYLKPEWTGTQRTGYVDFAVPSEGWIIGCVREGSKLKEHISRFQEAGKYTLWTNNQQVREFVILDFRRTMPRKQRGKRFSSFWPYPLFSSTTTVISLLTFFERRNRLALSRGICGRFLFLYDIWLKLWGCSGRETDCVVAMTEDTRNVGAAVYFVFDVRIFQVERAADFLTLAEVLSIYIIWHYQHHHTPGMLF